MISNIEIKKHYTINRGPQSLLEFCWFVLYFPIGLFIFLCRFTLGLAVVFTAIILSSNFPAVERKISNILCNIFGIDIVVDNPKKCASRVLVSNCVSPLDHLVLHCITGSVTPGNKMFSNLFTTAIGLRQFGSTAGNFEGYKRNISTFISAGETVHFQPEFKVTNGKSLLKFRQWPLTLSDRVQPVCIEVKRSCFNFPVVALDSSYTTDLFWYMFFPKTKYHIKFLPVVHKGPMGDEEFVEKLRGDIASALKIELSNYTASDLQEWEKRVVEERRRLEYQQNFTRDTNSRYELMANQVKEVLPMVPLSDIYTDLAHTRSVDQTITNLLEAGTSSTAPEESVSVLKSPINVPTKSEQSSCVSLASGSSSNSNNNKDALNTAAKTFGKSAQERMLSFHDRKKILIDNARRSYIEKHGLNVVGNS